MYSSSIFNYMLTWVVVLPPKELEEIPMFFAHLKCVEHAFHVGYKTNYLFSKSCHHAAKSVVLVWPGKQDRVEAGAVVDGGAIEN
jgi:hypothetical protein